MSLTLQNIEKYPIFYLNNVFIPYIKSLENVLKQGVLTDNTKHNRKQIERFNRLHKKLRRDMLKDYVLMDEKQIDEQNKEQNKEHHDILSDFAHLLCYYNYGSLEMDFAHLLRYYNYDSLEMDFAKNCYMLYAGYAICYIRLYENLDSPNCKYIISVSVDSSGYIKYFPGYYNCKFEKEMQRIYSSSVVEILLGCYTYEQFNDKTLSLVGALLLPDIWKIVYSYVIGPC